MPTVTFINHATVLIRIDGTTLLTDPVFSKTVGFIIPRLRAPGISLNRLPDVDATLISHADYDHLNLKSLRAIRRRNTQSIVLPRGLGSYGRRLDFPEVFELDLWQKVEIRGARITCVPAQHSSSRIPWNRKRALACGYVIEAGDGTVYFAGDTGYGEHFKEIGRRFALDVVLLPIGAYKPERWFRNIHLNPATAISAFRDLGARELVPIHWGTFKISDEPMREPPQWLRIEAERAGLAGRIHILENGDKYSWR